MLTLKAMTRSLAVPTKDLEHVNLLAGKADISLLVAVPVVTHRRGIIVTIAVREKVIVPISRGGTNPGVVLRLQTLIRPPLLSLRLVRQVRQVLVCPDDPVKNQSETHVAARRKNTVTIVIAKKTSITVTERKKKRNLQQHQNGALTG